MFSDIIFMIYILSSMLESYMLNLIFVMINLVRNLNLQLSISLTLLALVRVLPNAAMQVAP